MRDKTKRTKNRGRPGATPLDQQVDDAARTNMIWATVGKNPVGVKEMGGIRPTLRSVTVHRGATAARCPVCMEINSIPVATAQRLIICRGCNTSFYVTYGR
jgi:hypothetical protein